MTAPLPGLAEGSRAPAFKLKRDGGGEVSLAGFRGRGLVLYFYPKADTEGCTKEAQAFSALSRAFEKADIGVVGVSADPVKKLDAFRDKYGLQVALASDESLKMLEAYGVWVEKSMYGRTFMGVARTTFLIGKDGRIARIWPKVKVEGHAEEVLAAAKIL